MKHATLDVVSVVSNPIRYATRIKLYKEFMEYMAKEENIRHWTVEIAFGDRPFEVTEEGNPRHIRFRTYTELWHKENMINLAVQRFPPNWEYIAWIDGDIRFARPDWAVETMHQLQHYQFVQMFSQARDMTPELETFQTHKGYLLLELGNY